MINKIKITKINNLLDKNNKLNLLIILFILIIFNVNLINAYTYIDIPDESRFNQYEIASYFVNQDPDPAEPGGYVDVRFKIQNIGTEEAENVLVEILPEYPFSLDPGQEPIQRIGKVWGKQIGKEGVIIRYRLRIADDALAGENEIKIRYSLDNGKSWIQPKNYVVMIGAKDPILGITSFYSEPQNIRPGSNANLTLVLKNFAPVKITDIRVSLNLIQSITTSTATSYEELPFSPIKTTNQKIIKTIYPFESIPIVFNLAVDPDADSKNYKIPVTIEYKDELGNNYSKLTIVSLSVKDESLISINLEDSEIYQPGQHGRIAISFTNIGTDIIKFFDVELLDSNDIVIISSPHQYLGNIDSDDYETAEFEIYVKGDKKDINNIPLKIHYTYFDSHNIKHEKEDTLFLRLYSEEELNKYGIIKKNHSFNGLFVIIIIVIIGIFIYKRWKHNKNPEHNK